MPRPFSIQPGHHHTAFPFCTAAVLVTLGKKYYKTSQEAKGPCRKKSRNFFLNSAQLSQLLSTEQTAKTKTYSWHNRESCIAVTAPWVAP